MEILRWSCRHWLISDNIDIGASETVAHFCSHGGRPPDSISQLIGPLWLSTWNRYSTAWRKSATFTCLVGVNRLLAGPSFVERVKLVNPTAYAVDVEGCSGCTVSHNVIRNANVFAGVSNGGSPTSNLIVRDNLFQNGGIGSEGSATFTASYNLNCSCSGLGNITGTPIYTGGTNPTTYGGFHLASGSPGKGAGRSA